ncbi:MAG: hypothetical protein NVS3B20_26970 [Polyangiales bacterium]
MVLTLGSTRLRLDDPVARALEASSLGEDQPMRSMQPSTAASAAIAPSDASIDASATAPSPVVAEGAESTARAAHDDKGGGGLPTAPRVDRRRTWRGASLVLEVVALILGILVLALSAAGFYWLLRK